MKSTAIKFLQALLLVLTLTGAELQAQSGELEFTPEEQAWINANPIIKVGGETDWAPFEFADAEGQHTGIVADYLDLLSARTGLQFEVRLDSFTNLMSALDSGDIDLLPAVYSPPKWREPMNLPRLLAVLAIALMLTFLTEVTSNTATTSIMLPILGGAAAPALGVLAEASELSVELRQHAVLAIGELEGVDARVGVDVGVCGPDDQLLAGRGRDVDELE